MPLLDGSAQALPAYAGRFAGQARLIPKTLRCKSYQGKSHTHSLAKGHQAMVPNVFPRRYFPRSSPSLGCPQSDTRMPQIMILRSPSSSSSSRRPISAATSRRDSELACCTT
eukprot:7710721-Heterocapsa_arctica.AAC.1